MGAIASQITSLTIVFSTVYLATDQRKHQTSASLAFVRGIHRNSPHKWPVTRKIFPFDDVIMFLTITRLFHHLSDIEATLRSLAKLVTLIEINWELIVNMAKENITKTGEYLMRFDSSLCGLSPRCAYATTVPRLTWIRLLTTASLNYCQLRSHPMKSITNAAQMNHTTASNTTLSSNVCRRSTFWISVSQMILKLFQ